MGDGITISDEMLGEFVLDSSTIKMRNGSYLALELGNRIISLNYNMTASVGPIFWLNGKNDKLTQ